MVTAVTTATGQLGGAVIRALKDLGRASETIGLARSPEKGRDLGVEIRPGDYDDRDGLTASLKGVDAVLLISNNQPPSLRPLQHRNVIEAAKMAGVSKIVFTSVQGIEGAPDGSVGASFLQTEDDLISSGLDWVIGRNGVYIEPDLEYVATYAAAGEIVNCAGAGRCGYTTRDELAFAYASLLLKDDVGGKRFNLNGPPITQAELAAFMSRAFGLPLAYREMSPKDYLQDRVGELGPEMGPIIAGIYTKIRNGGLDFPSDFEAAAGRPHIAWNVFFNTLETQRYLKAATT